MKKLIATLMATFTAGAVMAGTVAPIPQGQTWNTDLLSVFFICKDEMVLRNYFDNFVSLGGPQGYIPEECAEFPAVVLENDEFVPEYIYTDDEGDTFVFATWVNSPTGETIWAPFNTNTIGPVGEAL